MFKNAIVKRPCRNIVHAITTANLGRPDYHRALEQHNEYITALKACGVEVTVLEADEEYPDSTFVEDTAVLTEKCAIIANPVAPSRKGEVVRIKKALERFYTNFEYVMPPGTLDGGDVMRVGDHFYVGLSRRTNREGARQLIRHLERYGYTGSTVELKGLLHLKSGVAYIENNYIVVGAELKDNPSFRCFNIIEVDAEEAYAANCIWVNGYVLIARGFEKTRVAIEKKGYQTIEVDISEFQKVDGGLSCLSLRF